ncbi:MAG: hypothetical protein GQ527_01590, partial [Bacteroidales bacterium]|nr:hypothetical protein [Bacteroidales bacterium]
MKLRKNMQNKFRIKEWIIPILILAFMGSFSLSTFAQNKTKLSSQVKQLEKEIAYTNELIKETKKSRDVSVIQIKLLDQQIRKQESLIKKIRQEIQLVDQSIDEKQLQINHKEQELDALKNEYAKMIIYSRKNLNSFDRMMFIFASKDFNQAFKRLKYFEQY